VDQWTLFFLSVSFGDTQTTREVINADIPVDDYTPLQRAYSSRGPAGAGVASTIPDWASSAFVDTHLIREGNIQQYEMNRANNLAVQLNNVINVPPPRTQANVDQIVSFAERMYFISAPYKHTVSSWPKMVLNYGHTVSGNLSSQVQIPPKIDWGSIVPTLTIPTVPPQARGAAKSPQAQDAANSRWLIKYSFGAMDIDALSTLVYGELYIPLTIPTFDSRFSFVKQTKFPTDMIDFLTQYALSFERPFWGKYHLVTKLVRTIEVDKEKLTEKLVRLVSDPPTPRYEYEVSFQNLAVSDCIASFSINNNGPTSQLIWSVVFGVKDQKSYVQILVLLLKIYKMIKKRVENY